MSLSNKLKKKVTEFIEWILAVDSEKSHLEFQQEVRKQKREKAAASAGREER